MTTALSSCDAVTWCRLNVRPAFTTSLRKTISRPPCTGRRKWACTECSRLPAGASPHAALIVSASAIPPKTTGPYQSGVRPTHASPRRSCRSRSRSSSIAACCCSSRSVTSPPAERGGALLHDRPHRLLPVLAVEAGERVADLLPHATVDVGDQRRARDQALRALDGQRRLRGDGVRSTPAAGRRAGRWARPPTRGRGGAPRRPPTNRDSSRNRMAVSWPTSVGSDHVRPPSGDVPARR